MDNIKKEIQKNHQEVLDVLFAYEETRKKDYFKFILFICLSPIVFILGIFIFAFSIFNMYDTAVLLAIISLSVGTVGAVYFLSHANDIRKNFKKNLKNKCLKEALEAFGNIEWAGNKSKKPASVSNVGLNQDVLDRSALFADFNRRSIDDEFCGNYSGVNFDISETNMLYESGSGKNRTVINIFQGVIIQFDSNKKVLNRTMVATKGDMATAKASVWITALALFVPILNVVAGFFEDGPNFVSVAICIVLILAFALLLIYKEKSKEPLNKVSLEDPEFNKRFNVYSSDEIEARYLVTPSFMERLNNLTTAFGTKKVKCSFFDDKFMIAISTKKDLFEIGKLSKPLTEPETIENFYKEIQAIYEMIDYFKLDEKTGL